ncbi:MAG: hypothetical protein ABL891_16505 [Burkholderiales bacterium]
MWRVIAIAIAAFSIAGCAQLPPTAQDVQAKKFEPVAGKSVIYIVRHPMDAPTEGPIVIGDNGTISTHRGTYYRWEATPGKHLIAGYGPYNASLIVQAEAGKIYYVQHSVYGNWRDGTLSMSLRQVDEHTGRKLVSHAQLL